MTYYEFFFKIAYSYQIKKYLVNSLWTISEFIQYITESAYVDFNIDSDSNIEIVESGQYNNINGRDPELAPHIEPLDVTIEEKYGNNYKNVAFYIRNKNTQTSTDNSNQNINLSLIHPDLLNDDDDNDDADDDDDDSIFNLIPSPQYI